MTYKFNSGNGAVCCDTCSVIIKEPADISESSDNDICERCRGMKHYSEMSLQEYNKAKSSGMFYEVWPEATGNPDEDLQAVCVLYEPAGLLVGARFFYDIIDEEAEYEF